MTTWETTTRARESSRNCAWTARTRRCVPLSKNSMSSTRTWSWKNSSLVTMEMQSLSRKGAMTTMITRLSSKAIRWMARMMRQWSMTLHQPMVSLPTHSISLTLSTTKGCQQIITMTVLLRWVESKRITRWMTSSSTAAFQRRRKSDSTRKGFRSKCTSTNNNFTTIMDFPSKTAATQSQAKSELLLPSSCLLTGWYLELTSCIDIDKIT
jgi:hypothetical protein